MDNSTPTNPLGSSSDSANYPNNSNATKSINKHVFVWGFNFLLGCFAVDRFYRGQIVLGIIKVLLFVFLSPVLGIGLIWPLVDLFVSIKKAYFDDYKDKDEFTFINGHYDSDYS